MSNTKSARLLYPDLAGKVALVTGSSRGIGAETARHLAANQVKVVVNGRQPGAIERVVSEIKASGGTAIGCVADCSKTDQLERMRQEIERQFGAVTLLFAFAGGDGNPEPIEDLTEERWDGVMAGNLKSKFFTVKSFLPGMKQQGMGSIVLMCSAAGRATSQASLAYSSAQAEPCAAARQSGYPCECDRAFHRNERQDPRIYGRRSAAEPCRIVSGSSDRAARGHRFRGLVPKFRGLVVDYRYCARCRGWKSHVVALNLKQMEDINL